MGAFESVTDLFEDMIEGDPVYTQLSSCYNLNLTLGQERGPVQKAKSKLSASMITKELTVGEVAARAGVAVSAIRFYESKALIKGYRTAGNQRRYPREVLSRVAVIRGGRLIKDEPAGPNLRARYRALVGN